jgi:hypothetical protein
MIRRNVLPVLMLAFVASIASAQNKLAVFSGTVVDAEKKPLGNAEVFIGGMNLTKTTDDKGVFRMETVTSGVHRVTVRKIGYAQLDTTMVFPEDQEVVWRVTMTEKLVTLDSVIVRAPLDPLMEDFEANRKRGLGRFMTRSDLAKMDGVSLQNVLRGMQGVDIIRTNSTAAYITSKRAPITGCQVPRGSANNREALQQQEAVDECLRRERIFYVPDVTERRQGIARACYPLGYVDRQLMNPGRPTPPFDIGQYSTDRIEAVEWYESASQTPPKYNVNSGNCGVLILHLRKGK